MNQIIFCPKTLQCWVFSLYLRSREWWSGSMIRSYVVFSRFINNVWYLKPIVDSAHQNKQEVSLCLPAGGFTTSGQIRWTFYHHLENKNLQSRVWLRETVWERGRRPACRAFVLSWSSMADVCRWSADHTADVPPVCHYRWHTSFQTGWQMLQQPSRDVERVWGLSVSSKMSARWHKETRVQGQMFIVLLSKHLQGHLTLHQTIREWSNAAACCSFCLIETFLQHFPEI